MADVVGNIQLRTTGGDDSASEINKATSSLKNMTSASSGMENQFQHRFQHIGLMLFAGDALRASGLGAETRQVIGGLNTALMGAQAAFGAGAGPIFLFGAALAALVGIVIKVTDHGKEMNAVMDKTITTQQAALKATSENVEIIKKYNDSVGGAGGLLASEKALSDLQSGELLEGERKQVAAIKLQMEANIQHAKVMQVVKDIMEGLATSFENFGKNLLNVASFLTAGIIPAYKKWADAEEYIGKLMKTSVSNTQLSAKSTAELAKKNAELKVKLDQLFFSIQHQGKAWKDVMTDANKYWDEVVKGIGDSEAATDKFNKHIAESMGKTIQYIGESFGSVFAKIIVEGGDLGDEMEQMAIKMAEKFIESTIEMIIYWTVLRAVMSVIPGGAEAFQAAATSAYPGIANMAFDQAGESYSEHALGGEILADRPTLAMFGEGGPERATFTPLSGGGKSSGNGGSGGVNIGTIQVNAYGVTDPKEIANRVGQEIVKMIRGQGQISFVRA